MFKKWWLSLNYRYCKVQQYLAAQRGDTLEAIHWSDQAYYWRRSYIHNHAL